MVVFSIIAGWWLCGVAAMGLNNAYNIKIYCDNSQRRLEGFNSASNVFSVAAGPVSFLIALPTTGFGHYGFSLDPGCPDTRNR